MTDDDKFVEWVRESWGEHQLPPGRAQQFDEQLRERVRGSAGGGLGLWESTASLAGALVVLVAVAGATFPSLSDGTRTQSSPAIADTHWWSPAEDGYAVATIAPLDQMLGAAGLTSGVGAGLDAASALAWLDAANPYDEIVDVLPGEYASLSALIIESTQLSKSVPANTIQNTIQEETAQ